MSHFDIIIVGGGLVGASFARAIAGSGLKTLVVDKLTIESLYHPTLDNRGLALAYSTSQILRDLNCWQHIANHAFAIETVHVSEQHSFGFTKLTAKSLKIPALGYVVSASNLGKAIAYGLDALPDITVLRPAAIDNASFDAIAKQWIVTINNTEITTDLIVAADGANSKLRAWQNIAIETKEYNQAAIVTNVAMDATQNNTIAYERFTEQGVIALLPFGKQILKCVWTAPLRIATELNSLSDIEFSQKLQEAFGFRLGRLMQVGDRKSFNIVQTHAKELYANRLVLIGNAANTLHPVAAQGFNLGIRDAIQLSKLLRSNTALDLENYTKMRYKDQHETRKLTNFLVDVFARDEKLLKFARRLGIVTAQFISPLNKKIITQGMGRWI